MTVKEAAQALEVSPATIYALCRAQQLGHTRIGVGRGTIRITPEDIERFKAASRVEPRRRPDDPVLPYSGLTIPFSAADYVPTYVPRPGKR